MQQYAADVSMAVPPTSATASATAATASATAATASATAATELTYRDLQTYAAEVSIDMDSKGESVAPAGTHFTCFTSTKVLRCTQCTCSTHSFQRRVRGAQKYEH